MFFKTDREKLFLASSSFLEFLMFLGLWLLCNLYLHFLMVFPCMSSSMCLCCGQLLSALQPSQSSAKVPSPKSGHIHGFQGSGHSHIFLRLPSCHYFCLATHPLQIASWDTHCLKWTLHQSRQQPWWTLVTPFGNEWNRGEAQGWEISWHEMGLGCEAVRGTEINMGKLTNLWWKTSIA